MSESEKLLPPNPFEDASMKWDKLNRDLMTTRDEVKHWTEQAGEMSEQLSNEQATHAKAFDDLTTSAAAETDRLNLQIEKLTRERDAYKTFSIQMTVRLRDFGTFALKIVEEAKVATVADPEVAKYAPPVIARQNGEPVSAEDTAEVARILGNTAESVAA